MFLTTFLKTLIRPTFYWTIAKNCLKWLGSAFFATMRFSKLSDWVARSLNRVPLHTVLIVPFVLQIFGVVGLMSYLTYRHGQQTVSSLANQLMVELSDRVEQTLLTELAISEQLTQDTATLLKTGIIDWRKPSVLESYFRERLIQLANSHHRISSVFVVNSQSSLAVETTAPHQFLVRYSDASMPEPQVERVEANGKRQVVKRNQLLSGDRYWVSTQLPALSIDQLQAQSQQLRVTIPYPGIPTLITTHTHPISNRDGEKGVVGTSVSLIQFGDSLKALRIGKTGQAYVIDRQGFLIATSTGETPFRTYLPSKTDPEPVSADLTEWRLAAIDSQNPVLHQIIHGLAQGSNSLKQIRARQQFPVTFNHQRYFVTIAPLQNAHGLNWLTILILPETDFAEKLNPSVWMALALGGAALVVTSVIGLLTVRRITQPLRQLNAAAKKMSTGQLDQWIATNRTDDIGELAHSFNQMAKQLQASFSNLQTLNNALSASEHRLTLFLEALPVGVLVYSADGKIIYHNSAAEQWIGQAGLEAFTSDDRFGTYRLYRTGTTQLYPLDERPLQRALRGERVHLDDIAIFWNGETVPFEVRAMPIVNEQGTVQYAILTFQDRIERQRAEQILTDYHRTLEAELAKQTETLRQREELLQLVIQADNDAIWDWNIVTGETFRSSQWAELLGYGSNESYMNHSWWMHNIHPEDAARVLQANWAYLNRETDRYSIEYRMRCQDGSYKWLLSQGVAQWNEQGVPLRMVGVNRDLTAQKQTENALRQSEAKLNDILNSAVAAICCFRLYRDFHVEYEFFSAGHALVFGYSPEEFSADPNLWASRVHPDDWQNIILPERQNLMAVSMTAAEYRFYHKDGSLHWISDHLTIRRDQQADCWMITALATDITARKQAEMALYQSEEQRQLALALTQVGFWDWDIPTGQVIWNDNQYQLFGLEPGDRPITQQFWLSCIHPEDRDRIQQVIDQVVYRPQTSEVIELASELEYRVVHPDGQVRWLLSRGQPILDASGRCVRRLGVAIDITERKQTEALLYQRERQLQQVINAMPAYVAYFDHEQRYQFVNHRYEERLGVTTEQILGLHLHDLISEPSYQGIQHYIDAALVGQAVHYTDRQIDCQGNPIDLEVMLTPDMAEDGAVKGCYCLALDISSRLQVEEALRESEQRFRSAFDTSASGIALVALDGRFLQVNSAFCEMLGYSEAEMLQLTVQEISYAEDHAIDLENLQALIAGDVSSYHIEKRYRHKNGHLIWGLLGAAAVRDAQHRLLYIVGQVQNITQRKEAEAELRSQQAFLRQVINAVPCPIFVKDRAGLCLVINQAMADLYETTVEAMLGKTEVEVGLLSEAQLERFHANNQEVMQTGQPMLPPIEQLPNGQGKLRYYQTLISPFRDADGEVQGIIGSSIEITERIMIEQELRCAKDAAEASNAAKSQFLANMSHELRTPLNAILGFAELMLNADNLTLTQRDDLQIILQSGENLLELINEILDLSKIEAERMALNPSTFDLTYLLNDLEELLKPKAHAKGLQFIVDCHPDVPPVIQADAQKLWQVLLNLLNNALKFTQAGCVSLQVSRLTSDDPSSEPHALRLQFRIQDTGFGIDPEELQTLFTPFSQTEAGRQSHQGTGLGLVISRKFVQLMGGDITVKSQLGFGSTFQFSIEAQVAALPPEVATPKLSRRVVGLAPADVHYRILVVDDIPEHHQPLVRLLQSVGFETQVATTGEEAIALWMDYNPHLIWLDVRLPDLDGYEVVKRIRAVEREQAFLALPQREKPIAAGSFTPLQTVIIALSASVLPEDCQRMLDAGCDDFVAKPYSEATIFNLMQQYLGVHYLYDDSLKASLDPSSSDEEALTQALASMPSSWLKQVHFAAQIGDDEEILRLLQQVPPSQDWLADRLAELARYLQLDRILDLTQDLLHD